MSVQINKVIFWLILFLLLGFFAISSSSKQNGKITNPASLSALKDLIFGVKKECATFEAKSINFWDNKAVVTSPKYGNFSLTWEDLKYFEVCKEKD